jgi:hypothetical protein
MAPLMRFFVVLSQNTPDLYLCLSKLQTKMNYAFYDKWKVCCITIQRGFISKLKNGSLLDSLCNTQPKKNNYIKIHKWNLLCCFYMAQSSFPTYLSMIFMGAIMLIGAKIIVTTTYISYFKMVL